MALETNQILISLILLITVAMFLWGRWRHDMVAMGALIACAMSGLIKAEEAFQGFGHPAVITVACVLILSAGLQQTGAIDALAHYFLPKSDSPTLNIAILTTMGAILSSFMNNVGALALLMPIALRAAQQTKIPPGKILMPLSFGSILGGTTTLIGTPSNLIVSGFRAKAGLGSFGIFDFTPVGLVVMFVGVVFLIFLGWRLVPSREQTETGSFDTAAYLTEVRIVEGHPSIGKPLRDLEAMLEETDAQIVGFVRNDYRVSAPQPRHILRANDILVIEAEPTSLASILSKLGLKLEESPPTTDASSSYELILQEMVVMPETLLVGRSAKDIKIRTRYSINLLAISREGSRSVKRLRSTRLLAGDVLLLQGSAEALAGFAGEFYCVPLAPRDIRVPHRKQAFLAGLVMFLSVTCAATNLLPVAIAFAAGALAMLALRLLSTRSVYQAVDWPVVVLLAAMLPVAGAMSSTGAADVIASFLIAKLTGGKAILALAVMLIVTLLLTDFMNNAATAAVMSPIALSTAKQLNASPDTFLMAVAIGASCAFMTPIGHQNNTLILGPGGFRFGDYWRMGLPTGLLVLATSLPMLLWFWGI